MGKQKFTIHKYALVALLLISGFNSFAAQSQDVQVSDGIMTVHAGALIFMDSGLTQDEAKIFGMYVSQQNALDLAGSYLASNDSLLSEPIQKDGIVAVIGNAMHLQILDEATEIIDSQFAFRIKVEASLDLERLNQRIELVRNNLSYKKQLTAEIKHEKALFESIHAFTDPNFKVAQDEIKKLVSAVFAVQWYYRAFQTTDLNLRIEYLSKSIDLDPEFILAYLHRGHAYKLASKFQEAILDFTRAVDLDPENDSAYENRGVVYAKLDQYEEAINDYTQAIKFDSTNATVFYNRAKASYELEHYENAIQDYSRSIVLNPDDPAAYKNRGSAYFASHKHLSAIADYSKAISLDPNDATTFYNKGCVYYALKQHEYAKNNFTRAIELDPTYVNAYGARGNAYKDMNQIEKAVRDYRKYLNMGGGTEEVNSEIIEWMNSKGYSLEN